jgi:hypothetical protein
MQPRSTRSACFPTEKIVAARRNPILQSAQPQPSSSRKKLQGLCLRISQCQHRFPAALLDGSPPLDSKCVNKGASGRHPFPVAT